MQIAILNYSGNVGKTTIARDILKNNLKNHSIISIDTINSDGKEEIIIKGEEGDKIYAELLFQDNVILDIGSSNLEIFLKYVSNRKEIFNNISHFIIPTTPIFKQINDTIKTITELSDNFNVSENKIFVIGNFFDEFNNDNSDALSAVKELGVKVINKTIHKHNLYQNNANINDLLTNENFKELMLKAKNEGNETLAREYAYKFINQQKIQDLNKLYSDIFNEIFGGNNG